MEIEKKEKENRNKNIEIRLNKFLAQCGLGSRRECDKLIESGHIYCNGKKVTTLGIKINPDIDKIEYRGKKIEPIRKLEYFVYYKPREVIVSAFDPEGRKTIYEDLECRGKDVRHLKYAGRLDYQSEGLLLLTNDGGLIHALTHPRYRIKKVYHVKIQKILSTEEMKLLLDGVMSEGEIINADEIKPITIYDQRRKQFWYEVVLYQGKNRQIRRLFEAINVNISRLKRVQFAHLKIGELMPGEIRPLSKKEIEAMKNIGYKS